MYVHISEGALIIFKVAHSVWKLLDVLRRT